MQLGTGGKGLGGLSDGKQSPVLIVVLVVVIIAAGFLVVRPYLGGGESNDYPAPGAVPGPPSASLTPDPGAGAPQPGQPAGAPAPAPVPPGAYSPGAAAPAAPAAPAATPVPAPRPSAPPVTATNRSSAPKPQMRSMKVFGSVTVNYPAGWGVDISAANRAAVFTNGTASFEVYAPDPQATTAKAIADSALKALASGGAVTGQSAGKVANQDAYTYTVNVGGTTQRIVGVDAPTRVVIVASAKSGQFASYAATFDEIAEGLRFGR